MSWMDRILGKGRTAPSYTLESVQKHFVRFLAILENNNQVLKIIGDMQQKSQGAALFDTRYIRSNLAAIRSGVRDIVDGMIAMGGEPYRPLIERYQAISTEIDGIFPAAHAVEEDDFTIPLENVGRDKIWSVGSKGAQLGEMKSKLGLPVPEGFAISAWAYRHFVDANNLEQRISDRLSRLDIKHYDDLVRASEEIRSIVTSSPVPRDLADTIRCAYAEVKERVPQDGFALRSSAIGEDTLLSFAGQYATFLNVTEADVIDRYREVLASKFTPQAIYYYVSHSFTESDLAMGVCCLAMVDAATSGVVYTRDPVHPHDGSLMIYAVFGLGNTLGSGKLAPDVYKISHEDGRVREKNIAVKCVRQVLKKDGGTDEEIVPETESALAALSRRQLGQLTEFAKRIEAHYGFPMDIEWAIDRAGRPFVLQARPLQVVESQQGGEDVDVARLEVLCDGGTTVYPGAGSGPVFHLKTTEDLSRVPDGAVLVAPLPFPGLVTVMGKVHALLTHTGSTASHMATLAREYGVPTLVGLERSWDLPPRIDVTVDATGRTVYRGSHADLVQSRRAQSRGRDQTGIYGLLRQVLNRISPLNLIRPDDPDFLPENCLTYHDITRFVHQRAMEEMFSIGRHMRHRDRVSFELNTAIPLKIMIIYIDRDLSNYAGPRRMDESEIGSAPMEAFWRGILEEGWPSHPAAEGAERTASLATKSGRGFSEKSFAVLGAEYMMLSLRMGYHFNTVEALCTDTENKNYIRFQCRGGGASMERRSRRIQLLVDLFTSMGFECNEKGDFLDARIAYQRNWDLLDSLRLIGRITMMTKQLDMGLANDAITKWYIRDFKSKLGIAGGARPTDA
jgi:pyruvate,water dikinase